MGIPGVQTQARLGRYELLARLATGGMGEIFLARLEGAAGFEKLYVVKRILPHLADDARFRQMLIAEARIASRLSHSSICQVYELGETDGQLYIVMEYLEGVTLLPLLRRSSKQASPLDLGLVSAILQQVCEALHYAHELKDRGESVGLVHRDVTPSNVFLTESGVVKVLDFGIAKAKGASTQTQEGTVKGKYAYMAPEQLRGAAIDRRVDVFALGVVVFEMLALRRLFQRKTDYLTFRAVMEQPIPDIRRYRPDVPEGVALALGRALERDSETRFETTRQLGTTILDALGRRPWTQSEIGDFVRSNFAEQLGRRSAQVQVAVQRTQQPAGFGRTTMPLIAQEDRDQHEGDEDDESLVSIETDVDVMPAFQPTPAPRPRAPSSPAEFIEGTPPPFSGETTGGSLRMLEPVANSPAGSIQRPRPVMVMSHRSSLIWPLLAAALVAVTGIALYLVYQQKQQAPTVVRIEQTPANDLPKTDPPPAQGSQMQGSQVDSQQPAQQPSQSRPPDVAPGAGQGQGSQTPRVTTVRPNHTTNLNPYLAAIQPHLNGLNQCMSDHQSTAMSAGAAATVVVAPNGRARTVTWKPDVLDVSPLGACLKNILLATAYPTASGDTSFTWEPGVKRH